MRYLAVDYGRSDFGFAVSNGLLAEPYKLSKSQISNLKSQNPNSKLKTVKTIIQRERIKKIIIGVSEGKMAEETRKFGELLKKAVGLPVEYYDETLTSQKAVKKMIEAGKRKKFRKEEEHNIAACIILQNYLDTRI